MAWIYLAESEESQKPWRTGSDRLPIVRPIDTPNPFCFPEWRQEISLAPRSGTTSKLSEDQTFPRSTSSTADFPVKTSVLQDMARAWKEAEAGFFSRSCAWPKKSSPLSYSLKTSPLSELEVPVELSKNWPPEGMTVGGALYPLKMSERLTSDSDGSCLLPTPSASSYGTNQGGAAGRTGRVRPSLETMARKNLWPTPQAHDAQKGYAKRVGRYGTTHGARNLNDWVVKWPTPTASEAGREGPGRKYGNGSPTLSGQAGGQLNPTWVEWLMGYPPGWTELSAWVTPWFRSK